MSIKPRRSDPCAVQQMGRADFYDQRQCLGGVAQIGSVPSHADGWFAAAGAVDGMDFAVLQPQPAQAMHADEPGSAGDEDTRHAEKSGQLASRSAMTVSSAGH